jgi:hypothetical protein
MIVQLGFYVLGIVKMLEDELEEVGFMFHLVLIISLVIIDFLKFELHKV